MLDSVPFLIFVGTVLGFLSGLGIGGGSLLILWLTLVVQLPQDTSQKINLMFFVPTALIACCFRLKQGTLEIKRIVPALIAGTASAILFSWIGTRLDTELLRKPFGILLLITGLKEFFHRQRKAR